jgi:hypothetical protein
MAQGPIIQGVSEGALQWHSKCYCVASVTKTFTFKGRTNSPSFSALNCSNPETSVQLTILQAGATPESALKVIHAN